MDNYYQQLLAQKGFYLKFQVALRKTRNNRRTTDGVEDLE